MGRHKKLADSEWQYFLKQLQAGRTITSICEELGIDRSTPYRKRDRDGQFAAEWDLAERISVELLGDMVVKAALRPETVEKFDSNGNLVERIIKPPNLHHAIRVLERRHPHWKPTAEVSDDHQRANIASASIVNGRLRFGRTGSDV